MPHTPGPWTFATDGAEVYPTEGQNSFVPLAFLNGAAHDSDWLSKEEAIDNARLIAAAPELLAALKLLRNPEGDGRWPCYCDDPAYAGRECENCVATAAINKAEGRR